MTGNEGLPRRALLGGMAALGAAASLPAGAATTGPAAPESAPAAGKVPVQYGGFLYDRMMPLYLGQVKPEGIDFTYDPADPQSRALFDKVERGQFDVAEMSASEYVAQTSAGTSPFVALPVFPSRIFRQSFVIVNRRSAIKTPKDLEGKRVGVPLYTITAAIWIRGFLQHQYGVDLGTIKWVQGNMDKPGKWGNPKVPPLLKPVSIENNKSDKSLIELLESRELDAIVTAGMPKDFDRKPQLYPNIVRMFPNFHEVERDYYVKTRIFPVMHLVVIRKALYDKHPFVARSLYRAFTESKNRAIRNMTQETGGVVYMLPWMRADTIELQHLFGDDLWPYGVEANRPTLEALVNYMAEQAMIREPIPLEKLFLQV